VIDDQGLYFVFCGFINQFAYVLGLTQKLFDETVKA